MDTDTVLTHVPSHAFPDLVDDHDGDIEVESENDWFTELPPTEPVGKMSSKALEATLVEVSTYLFFLLAKTKGVLQHAIWQSSSPSTGSVTANYGSATGGNNLATSQESSSSSNATVDPLIVPGPPQQTWPAETDLLLMPGSNKVMLTLQRPVMRAVFQETFERIRAAMVFQNAFPNVYDTVEMISDTLIKAAESIDHATNIFNRLVMDSDYTTNMSRLVSVQSLNIMLLILFSASCTHPHFLWGG